MDDKGVVGCSIRDRANNYAIGHLEVAKKPGKLGLKLNQREDGYYKAGATRHYFDTAFGRVSPNLALFNQGGKDRRIDNYQLNIKHNKLLI